MYALGNFGTLVKAISCDPAMLVWLDLGANQKEHPNENLARELMELFTLGEGHYTENDIKEAARAFTCYRTDGQTQESRFVGNQFDRSSKTFMGKTGPWRGDEIIDIILAQPQCAKFIGGGLPVRRILTADDHRDSRRALQKLSQCIFLTSPKPEFLEKFIQIANSKPQPLDDHAIRELAVLMMSTPNYQVC